MTNSHFHHRHTQQHYPQQQQPRKYNQYFSRHRYDNRAKDFVKIDVTYAKFVGIYSPWALLWGCIFLLAPASYLYIVMVLVRELFAEHLIRFGQAYNVPLLHQWTLASAISSITLNPPPVPSGVDQDAAVAMDHINSDNNNPYNSHDTAAAAALSLLDFASPATRTPRQWLWFWIEVWCYFEAVFFILLRLRIRWLQCEDPLEASFSAAPLMELSERADLWKRMMDSEAGNITSFVSGWFFDEDVTGKVSAYDIRDFVAWSMFEGRHQEHLTISEVEQLEDFVDELQYRISLELYGIAYEDDCDDHSEVSSMTSNNKYGNGSLPSSPDRYRTVVPEWKQSLPKPKRYFQFQAETQSEEESNFFSNLFESYRQAYDRIEFNPVQDFKNMVQKAAGDSFHPVQDFKNLVAETAQNIADADPVASASQKATQVYETLVPTGSLVDKQLTAVSNATYQQLLQAWDSVKTMSQHRLKTARFLSKQRQRLQQQLKGYQVMLGRLRDMSSGVPSKQMATLMRRITECYESIEHLEERAEMAFVQMTGFALKNLSVFQRKEPQRFAKYSSDPIMSIATYPLSFHLLILGGTEIPLRIMMRRRGFERRTLGPVSYYYHPGKRADDEEVDEDDEMIENDKLPVVFVHGIGIGLIVYLPLIDALLESGRPIYLPEITYVSGFRPWQSKNSVLPPAVVSSTMVAMLASNGHLSATWTGHSYGTSWLSYMVKYAPEAVAAILFLDPICFCLHFPRLTKQFVYTRPDPGTISYIVRTDLIVSRTIQRSFPWSRIVLFAEQIHVPCCVFISEKDALVPSEKVESYLRSKNVPVQDFETVRKELLQEVENEENGSFYGNSTTSSSRSSTVSLSEIDDQQRGDDTNDSISRRMQCIVFRGLGHGDWTENSRINCPVIAHSVELLCQRVERSMIRSPTSSPQRYQHVK